MSGQFDNLLKDIEGLTADNEALAKALPTADGEDDEKIQAAAADGDDKSQENADADDKGGEDKDEPMAKSFKVKLADGTEVEAEDGTALVKALTDRLDATEGTMAKALGGAVALIKSQSAILKQQGDLLKSLTEQVKKLGGEGRGRKATVVVTEKQTDTTLAKGGQQDGITPQEFMLKANSAFEAGKLTGRELNTVDVCLRNGWAIEPALIQKIVPAA
jgi:hypothetical protein